MNVLEWVEPEHGYRRGQIRLQAQNEFAGPLADVVLAVWKDALPSETARREAVQEVRRGLRQVIRLLTTRVDENFLTGPWRYWQGAMPSYWEPPAAMVPPSLPSHQLRAYRWTASIIALCVRDALETLHSKYTDDDVMPALNRGLRNVAYDLLLTHTEIAWEMDSGVEYCEQR